MKRVIEFDDAFLGACDRAVLFVWDWLEVSRFKLVAPLLLGVAVIDAAGRVWVSVGMMGIALLLEARHARSPSNQTFAFTRCLPAIRALRIAILASFVVALVLDALSGRLLPASRMGLMLAYQALSWTLTPQDPPNPPRRKLALVPVRAR